MTSTIDDVVKSIKNGTAVVVSDGYFKDDFGTSYWIIENGKGTDMIVGIIDVPGYEDEYDAYRSEITGLYGIVAAVGMLEKIGNIEGSHVEVECDGMSVLHRSFEVED